MLTTFLKTRVRQEIESQKNVYWMTEKICATVESTDPESIIWKLLGCSELHGNFGALEVLLGEFIRFRISEKVTLHLACDHSFLYLLHKEARPGVPKIKLVQSEASNP